MFSTFFISQFLKNFTTIKLPLRGMRSHQRMFNTGLLLTPCNRQNLGIFPLITAFFCLCEMCWTTSLCSKLCFPFCSFLLAAALPLGRSPEVNLSTAYSFLIVKYSKNTTKTMLVFSGQWQSQAQLRLRKPGLP